MTPTTPLYPVKVQDKSNIELTEHYFIIMHPDSKGAYKSTMSGESIIKHLESGTSISVLLPKPEAAEISEEEVQEKIKQSIIDAFNSGKREESHSISAIENAKTGKQFYLEGEHYYKTLSLPSSNRQTEAVEIAELKKEIEDYKKLIDGVTPIVKDYLRSKNQL